MKHRVNFAVLLCFLILLSCSAEHSDWKKAQRQDNPESYKAYLAQYPKGAYVADANKAIENFAWQDVLKKNTIEGYQAYLVQYPESTHSDAADERIEELTWLAAVESDTVAAYQAYLTAYPEGTHVEDANEYMWSQGALLASQDTREVVLTTKAGRGHLTVVPYGRDRVLTIFNPQLLGGDKVRISYKTERSIQEKPVLVASFTEANIAAMVARFYYFESSNLTARYDMLEKVVEFRPVPEDWVSGKTKVSVYFMQKDDLRSIGRVSRHQAISNIVTFYVEY